MRFLDTRWCQGGILCYFIDLCPLNWMVNTREQQEVWKETEGEPEGGLWLHGMSFKPPGHPLFCVCLSAIQLSLLMRMTKTDEHSKTFVFFVPSDSDWCGPHTVQNQRIKPAFCVNRHLTSHYSNERRLNHKGLRAPMSLETRLMKPLSYPVLIIILLQQRGVVGALQHSQQPLLPLP